MTTVIHKLTLEAGITAVTLPQGGKFLAARLQRDDMQVWFSFDPRNPLPCDKYLVVVALTGVQFDSAGWKYLGTDMSKDYCFVGHVYYRPA